MSFKRGDIGLARFPHASGGRGKKRPVVVIQADTYSALRHVIVAEVTGNLSTATDPANLLIEIATPDGAATGLTRDSVVTCLHLSTMSTDRVEKIIGALAGPAPETRRLPEGRSWPDVRTVPGRGR